MARKDDGVSKTVRLLVEKAEEWIVEVERTLRQPMSEESMIFFARRRGELVLLRNTLKAILNIRQG